MKTKMLFLGLFLIVGLFIAGCTTETGNTTENTNENNAAGTQEAGSQDTALIGTYVLDTENSKIKWSASKIASNYHTGLVSLKSGTLGLTGDAAGGEFVIDMASISNDESNEALLKHLKSADFFNVEAYPESTVEIKSVTAQGNNNYEVVADLTILNTTNEIKFTAVMTEENDVLSAKADFEIDRTRWGLEYGSGSIFKELGDKAIKDNVAFTLDLKFNREE
ncbi:MAG: YceI family protein [Candidatus Nanoarchaeia archaeon]